jgi:transposase
MKGKRKRYEPEFKARVALEAIKGVKTIQQIAREYDIHPVQVSDWKRIMLSGAAEVFERGSSANTQADLEKEKEQLHATIGKLTVSVDFLKKKCKQLGMSPD